MDDNLASDVVALWQSELTAMAADRELRESWTAMVALWASSTHSALRTLPHYPYDLPVGGARAIEPAGSAAAVAASEPGLAQVEQLHQRIAELEQRLAEFIRRGAARPSTT